MANWIYNPSQYNEKNFITIPEGDYRVTINKVVEKTFSTGKEGFEITLNVPGYDAKLWHYLVLDSADVLKTNQRIGMFFDSFSIQDTDLSHYENWVGKDGAVRVRHDMYNGNMTAKVVFCLSRSQQDKITMKGNVFNTKDTTSQNTTQLTPKRDFNGFSF